MREGIQVGWQVAAEALRLFRVRMRFPSRRGSSLPNTAEEVTADWLNATVGRAHGWPEICSVRREDGDSGTTDRARLEIRYASTVSSPCADGGNRPFPRAIFVKTRSRKFATALFTNLMELGRNEVGFYRHLRDGVRIRTPEVFFADYDPASGRFILVLEDLRESSVHFMDVSSGCDAAQAEGVVRALGRLHASYWDSPRFSGDLAWVRTLENDPNVPLLRKLRGMATRSVLEKHADLIPHELRTRIGELDAGYDRLEAHWYSAPRTLLHGDPHIGNMYFCADEVGFFDWQVIRHGRAMRDLSYFLASSVPTALRQANQERWIGLYLETLRQEGVENAPDFKEAWQQYRLYSFYAWIAAIVTVAAGSFQSDEIARAGLVRTSRVLCELKSFDALTALG